MGKVLIIKGADFSQVAIEQITPSRDNVLVSVGVSPAGGGSATGSGSYPIGTNVTITAQPNSGYRFTGWSDGNTSRSRQITVGDSAMLFEAQFESTGNIGMDFDWSYCYFDVNNTKNSAEETQASIGARSIELDHDVVISSTGDNFGFCVLKVAAKKWNNGSSSASWIYGTGTTVAIPAGTEFSIQERYAKVNDENIPVEQPFSTSELASNILIVESA